MNKELPIWLVEKKNPRKQKEISSKADHNVDCQDGFSLQKIYAKL